MSPNVTIGLVDSGFDGENLLAARAFTSDVRGAVEQRQASADVLGHGTALGRIILHAAPNVRIVSAQVFDRAPSTTPAVVAAALDWLGEEAVDLVNLSFGVPRDRRVLRHSCERAQKRGLMLVGASPARGAPVYPSAYPGVLRVMGDARCAPGEISHLATEQADFGACPKGMGNGDEPLVGGASFAVAHVVGVLARYLEAGGELAGSIEHLRNLAKHHGPERRSARGTDQ